VPPAPNATELASVPVNVKVLLAVNVLPLAIVNVADVAGAVMATLLTLVADATPNVGVTSVGLVANTKEPEPVSLVTADAKLALEGVAKNVATPVPRPETPVEIGRPVQLVNVPELGVPRTGVVNVGLVNVLLVSVSLVARPTKVSVDVGRVNVPVFVMVEITGPVNVLLVRVCVPVNVTRVSVPEGTDSVLVPAVVMVNACALVMVMDDPSTPTLVILCALLSKPFFATKRFVVAMILYPLGELLYVNC
jgi:hypothetical protein